MLLLRHVSKNKNMMNDEYWKVTVIMKCALCVMLSNMQALFKVLRIKQTGI